MLFWNFALAFCVGSIVLTHGQITLQIFSQSDCVGTPTLATPFVPGSCNALLRTKIWCVGNNKMLRESFNDGCTPPVAGYVQADVNSCVNLGGISFNATGDCSVATANAPSLPASTAGSGDWIRVDYTSGACQTGTPTATVMFVPGVCLDGRRSYCENNRFKSVGWTEKYCNGTQSGRLIDLMDTTCTISAHNQAYLSCNGATTSLNTLPMSTLSTTNILTTATYSDNTCSTQIAQSYSAIDTCSPAGIFTQYIKYTCNGAMEAWMDTYPTQAACVAGTGISSRISINSTCVSSRGSFGRILGCGATVPLPPTSVAARRDGGASFGVMGVLFWGAFFARF